MRNWRLWLGVLISVGLLYFPLRSLRFDQVWQVLKGAAYIWLLPAVAVYFVAVAVRTWRWHYLLRPLKSVSPVKLFPIVTIGYMGNNIYPARAGEVLRAYVLRRNFSVPISASLATILVERVFDGVVMLMFVFVNLPELAGVTGNSGLAGSIRDVALLGAAAFFGALLIFLLAAMYPATTARVLRALLQKALPRRWREPVEPLVEKFLAGFASLRSPREALGIFVTSVIIWLLETSKYYLVMQAFSFRVSFFALMLMNGVVNLATTLPSAPGYLGTFDTPGIAVLEAFGVPSAPAAGYTLVLHAALWLPITALGAWFMTRQSLSWGKVRKEADEESVAAPSPGGTELTIKNGDG
ncbi:MAG: lysylphosphatidylglycerol synthase transmembrane domain-containing protein [Anaerolineales bacterium]|jgi:uncharacterized protein (TIRG00374 family)